MLTVSSFTGVFIWLPYVIRVPIRLAVQLIRSMCPRIIDTTRTTKLTIFSHLSLPQNPWCSVTLSRAATMASTLIASIGFSVTFRADSTKTQSIKTPRPKNPWRASASQLKAGRMWVRTMAAPDSISDKVIESIKNAEEVCAGDPVSGEWAAAWDEVEEVSAAASDARLKKKESESDPLENYCKDNPETDECRTYDD